MQRFFSLVAVLLACSAGSLAQTSDATATTNPVVSHAYVGSLTSGSGEIQTFAIHADGTAQVLAPIFSGPAGKIVANSHFVFASNAHTIATYTRNTNGTLRLTSTVNGIGHNDTPSGSAVTTLSLDRSGSSLYAGEVNFDGANNNAYSSWRIGSTGRLSFVDNSVVAPENNGQMVFSPGNHFAYAVGCCTRDWSVLGFRRSTTDGSLITIPTNAEIPPEPALNTPIAGPAAAVSKNSRVAISYGELAAGANNIALYVIQQDGSLTLATHSEKTTTFGGIVDMAFDPTGTWLAVVGFKGSANGGLQIFHVSSTDELSAGPHVLTSTNLDFVKWDNSGHVIVHNTSGLYVYNFKNGTLSHGTGSPHLLNNSSVSGLAVVP